MSLQLISARSRPPETGKKSQHPHILHTTYVDNREKKTDPNEEKTKKKTPTKTRAVKKTDFPHELKKDCGRDCCGGASVRLAHRRGQGGH